MWNRSTTACSLDWHVFKRNDLFIWVFTLQWRGSEYQAQILPYFFPVCLSVATLLEGEREISSINVSSKSGREISASSQKMIFRAERCRLYMAHFYFIFSCLEINRISGITGANGGLCACVFSLFIECENIHVWASHYFLIHLLDLSFLSCCYFFLPRPPFMSSCHAAGVSFPPFVFSVTAVAVHFFYLVLLLSYFCVSFSGVFSSFSSVLLLNCRCWTLWQCRLMRTHTQI